MKKVFKNPLKADRVQLKLIAKLPYYLILGMKEEKELAKMENSNENKF